MGRHKVLEKELESVFTPCEFGGPNLDPLQEQQWLLTREISLNHWLQCHTNYIPLKVIKSEKGDIKEHAGKGPVPEKEGKTCTVGMGDMEKV